MRRVFKTNKTSPKARRTLKDWLDLVLPLATLLLGIVSLWTTIQISGLEDFFRSEIARRNAEISSLALRSAEADRRLGERERRVDELSSIAERLGSQNDDQRLVLSQATLELDALRSEASTTKQQLEVAQHARATVEADLLNQQRALEIQAQREVYELVTSRAFVLRMNSLVGRDRSSGGRREIGAEFYQALQTVRIGDPRLDRYLAEIKQNFTAVCPAFSSRVVEMPSPPADPDYSAPAFRPIITSRDRDEFMTIWELKIAHEHEEWERRSTAYRSDLESKWNSTQEQFEACACSALTATAVDRGSICPA